MNIDPRTIEELKSLPPEELMRRVNQMEAVFGQVDGEGMTNIAQGTVEGGVQQAGLRRGVRRGSANDILQGKLEEYRRDPKQAQHDFDVPELERRTERARVESMTKRLVDAIEKQPWEAELILKGAQLEEWKRGHPVAYDDLRQAAEPLIRQAAASQESEQRKQVTRSV